MPGASSVLPGQSPPIALMWTPLPTMLSVRMVAYCLSAVAGGEDLPRLRSLPPASCRTRPLFPFLAGCGRIFRSRPGHYQTGGTDLRPMIAFIASVWNSDWAPLPIIAIVVDPFGAPDTWRPLLRSRRCAARSAWSFRSAAPGNRCRHPPSRAECGDGLQPFGRVLGVAVHILEAIGLPIGGRHQLDHTDVGVAGPRAGFCQTAPSA